MDIDALRNLLRVHPSRLPDLPAAQRRAGAVDAIERVLAAIESEIWPIRHWERHCLAAAVTYIRLGLYDAAFDQAEKAILPDHLRTTPPYYPAPEMPPFPPQDVRRDLATILEDSPLIEIQRVRPPPQEPLPELLVPKQSIVAFLREVWRLTINR